MEMAPYKETCLALGLLTVIPGFQYGLDVCCYPLYKGTGFADQVSVSTPAAIGRAMTGPCHGVLGLVLLHV